MVAASVDAARLADITAKVQDELAERASEMETATEQDARRVIGEAVRDVMSLMYDRPDAGEVEYVTSIVTRDFLQYGPLQPYLDDDTVTEIMVNAHDKVFVEREGVLERVRDDVFADDAAVRRLIDKIASQLNKHCDAQNPLMDARLADGSRVNAAIPPIARFGPSLTIRKFPKHRLTADDLVYMGACSVEIMQFLASMVESGCNILVSGGTGTGKTTLLNILCGFIPPAERVVTIEDVAEVQLTVEDWVSLEARTANSDGSGEVTIHDLVVNSLRQRPDRIIVGECRASETVEMLQAMNTGHDGSLTTVHANDPRAAFLRIETMVQAASNLSVLNIDMQISSAIQIVVQLARMSDGKRRISEVVALTGGMEGDRITTATLFKYVEDERGAGRHVPCGAQLPKAIMERVAMSGAYFDPRWLAPEEGGAQWQR